MKPIVIISGPTAAGKTALALALADGHPVDLINVDSAQVYRSMNIGTAKLEPQMLAEYPHALIDIRDPEDTYSVADFVADADVAIKKAHQAGRWPVLVGGTPLYIRALLYGLDALPSADPKMRQAIASRAESVGWNALYEELMTIDPGLKDRFKATDQQRIQRAFEIHQLTGQKPSDLMSHNRRPRYPSYRIVVTPQDRSLLHQRIASRFDEMLQMGFLEEVSSLMERPNLSADHASMKSVGYRQAWAYLDAGGGSLDALRSSTIAATRQLAKRQLTALRKLSQALWYDSEGVGLHDMAIESIVRFMEK